MTKKIILLIVFLIAGSSVYSQSKIGYVDSKKIIDGMQESQDAKLRLDNLVDEWQGQLRILQDSLKNMRDDYEKKKLILTEQLKNQREQEITALSASIDNYKVQKFGEGGEYFQKQKEFMKPVQDRVFLAIETVAKREDYDYVIDRSGSISLLFVNEKNDLTAKVVKVIEGR
ncbi:MAG TPA: OmpH family outer membrane protein [Ignavibacteria bacterium]|nr:OmpH family outer membrane protein [Ignavibacteria bacterium]